MQFQTLGNAQTINQRKNTLIIETDEATALVSVYSPAMFRVNITKTPDKTDHSFAVIQQPSGNVNYTDTGDSIEVVTENVKLVIGKSPLRFSFYNTDGQLLSGDDERFGVNWQGDRVTSYRKLFEDERFLGLGEKTGNLDRRGSHYVNWNSDVPNHGVDSDPLYETFPFYIGTHSGHTYGIFFDNTHKSYFDFGATTDHKMTWFGADGGDMNYYFFGAPSVAEIIKDYTWLTGRMEMPPLWSLGYQQCRWSYMSAQEVLGIAQTFRDHQIPADVMYCDIDYMDNFKIFTWNKETFANPKQFIDKLKEMNFKLVTIVDPGIKVEEGYKQYDEGVERDYFAKYPNGENYVAEVWPGRCHFPDFFREDVRQWWGESFTALTEPGVEGFWNDMNEPAAWGQNIPSLIKFGDKFMPEVRNAYGMEMARATYEGTKKILGKRPFVLTRAAYSGTQRYSAVWTGDNSAYDEHMLLGQRLVNSLGVSGMTMAGVDIGGFSLDPTPELMVRWNSLGVYTPMYRNHAQQGTVMREPWEWGAENEATIKKDIEQRYKLLPYIYSAYYRSTQTGLPVASTLAIDYTQDKNIYQIAWQNEFMFGDTLLVAPVISKAFSENVYLPAGGWYRFGTDQFFEGGQAHKVDAPLNNLPVFAKAGGILVTQNLIQSTNEPGDGILNIHIWNGEQGSTFVYYEDDGSSYDYQNGEFYKREIIFDPETRQVILGAVEGNYASKYHTVKIELHGFESVKLETDTYENRSKEFFIPY